MFDGSGEFLFNLRSGLVLGFAALVESLGHLFEILAQVPADALEGLFRLPVQGLFARLQVLLVFLYELSLDSLNLRIKELFLGLFVLKSLVKVFDFGIFACQFSILSGEFGGLLRKLSILRGQFAPEGGHAYIIGKRAEQNCCCGGNDNGCSQCSHTPKIANPGRAPKLFSKIFSQNYCRYKKLTYLCSVLIN